MRPIRILCLALLLPAAAFADKTVIETFTLAPGEKREISVETAEKVRLGWSHADDSVAGECKKMCVNMTKAGSSGGAASMYGMSMGIQPVDGKATATLENLESFPIEVVITRE